MFSQWKNKTETHTATGEPSDWESCKGKAPHGKTHCYRVPIRLACTSIIPGVRGPGSGVVFTSVPGQAKTAKDAMAAP